MTEATARFIQPLQALHRRCRQFMASTRGGAMLVGGAFVIMSMSTLGALMTNYAWREAQWEELRAGVRAAVASAGQLFVPGADAEETREAIASFASGVTGMAVDSSGVTVAYDAVSDTTTVVVSGTHEFDSLWISGDEHGDTRENVAIEVKARLEHERYEVALALDVSDSMTEALGDGTKMAALKRAVGGVVNSLRATNASQAGSVLVSLVPYSSAVNVADTGGAERTAAKERYVRMLAGARDTMANTLADARAAKTADEGGHWVDTFNHYGAASSHGVLQRRWLPADLLDDRDWNLRATDVDIDVSEAVPGLGTWTVDDVDFWNGCVMARWGAYWHEDARPAGWTADDAGNWPATKAVARWASGTPALAADTPLHLSDAPPDATDPNTLFTAYSWPDARIAGRADAWLSDTAVEMLDPGVVQTGRFSYYVPAVRGNDWTSGSQWNPGGNRFCPPSPVTPLSDDMDGLRSVVNDLVTTPVYSSDGVAIGTTHLHLGVVWALRTLSPHWRTVWNVRDARSVARPAVPCFTGGNTECYSLSKAIILVSDGRNFAGPQSTPLGDNRGVRNERSYGIEDRCRATDIPTFRDADQATTVADFNALFSGSVDADGRLTAGGREAFATAWFEVTSAPLQFWGNGLYPPPDRETPERRTAMLAALAAADGGNPATPWQLFSGTDASVIDALVAEDAAFEFDGRPTLTGGRCRPSSVFGPYGRTGDVVYAGAGQTPTTDVAPFEVASIPAANRRHSSADTNGRHLYDRLAMGKRMDEWLQEACRIAGERGVRIHGVHIGPRTDTGAIAVLERCVDVAGGDPDAADVYVTPTGDALESAFTELLTIRRNLRFL